MKITDTSINRPMLVAVLVSVVLILGAVSLSRLNIDLYPEMDLPVAAVVTQDPGVGPEEVEAQVTKPLESVLGTVNNLDSIQSTSSTGNSLVVVQYKWGTNMDVAAMQMRDKIDLVRQYLPDGVKSPMVFKMDPNMIPIMQLALSSSDPEQLKKITDDVIQPRLERTAGVASVWTAGGVEREIHVLVDPARLQGRGLSLNQLTAALTAENMNVSAGSVQEGSKDLLVRVTGQYKNLDQIRNLVISSPGGAAVHLGDVAQVTDGQKKTTGFSRVNGKSALTVFIQKQSGSNTVKVAQAVRRTIADLKQQVPGVKFDLVMDQSKYIEESITHVVREALAGGLLAVLVMWIFMRNLRSTLIISTAIPISIVGTFVLLYFNNMTLNLVSMGGLALGVGLIVDDAIVVLENIYRHRQQGYGLVDAAKTATGEVGGAVIASTLTTMAVFLPIVFVQGLAAQLFRPMALTVSFSIFTSLIVALTLVPLLASRLLKLEGRRGVKNGVLGRLYAVSGHWSDKLNDAYRRLLEWALGHRRLVIGGVVVLMVLSLAVFPLVGFEFMPSMDQGYVNVTAKMPRGTNLAATNRVAAQIEKDALKMPGVESIFTGVGFTGTQGMWGEQSTDLAQVSLKLADKTRRALSDRQIAEQLREQLKNIPGAKITVAAQDPNQMQGSGAPVSVKIAGDDLAVLTKLGDDLAGLIRGVPGAREVTSSLEEGRPEVQVLVDRDRAAAYGLSPADVAATVRTAIDGTAATQYHTGGHEVDIRVQLAGGAQARLADLAGLTITAPSGTQVPLSQVAHLQESTGPNAIARENGSRVVQVTAQLAGRSLSAVVRDIKAKMPGLALPPGYTLDFGGEQKQMAEAFGDLGLALILAVVLVYLVMVAQFESAIYPLIIMFSVPVTIIGVVFSLLVTGRAFSVPAFIGVIMLVGVVVKNAIVLIDYVNILRRRGLDRRAALLRAGPTRLRPILMTALTAILAMLPMALALGQGAEGQAPMATVVAGGLAFSTLITLVLVPVVYTILDDWKERWWDRLWNKGADKAGGGTASG
ncbi:efflux RND transporter permease subunit [Desulfotomaculum copahuensis]|uniref:Multidrug ABC transporter n=1 Tax=Desulfotomaculum copahuensis TaxID=1838280 RepID=A0A1B7LBF8_9FIRM|nr:efflux RND transporter permease subunit [Desulfotomaculum copahuensis]OAT79820.1 multidrug ABC transporter [Desulfotomaculum copahuensis]